MPLRQSHDESPATVDEWIRCGNQTTPRLSCKCRSRDFNFGFVVHRCCRKVGQGCRGISELAQEDRVIRRSLRVEDECHPPYSGRDLLEHLHPFPDHAEVDECEAGNVPARTREALDKALSDRIGDHREDNWNSAVASFSAAMTGEPLATMRSGAELTTSAAYAWIRGKSPLANRCTIW